MRRLKFVLLEKGEIDTIGAMAKKEGVSFSRGVSVVIKDHVRSVILAASNKIKEDEKPSRPIDGGDSTGAGNPLRLGFPYRSEIERVIREKDLVVTVGEVLSHYDMCGWSDKSANPLRVGLLKGVLELDREKRVAVDSQKMKSKAAMDRYWIGERKKAQDRIDVRNEESDRNLEKQLGLKPPQPVELAIPSKKEMEDCIAEHEYIISADEVIAHYGNTGWRNQYGGPIGNKWRKGVGGLNRGKKSRLEADRKRVDDDMRWQEKGETPLEE